MRYSTSICLSSYLIGLFLSLNVSASEAPELIAQWSFEDTLGWQHAAAGLAVHQAAERVNGNARSTGDSTDGDKGREYTADLLVTSLDAQDPSYVDFTVGLPSSSETTATLDGFSWQAKVRSFDVTPHNNVRLRLFWSIDNFAEPISTTQRLDTNQQLADNTWVGPWLTHNADFAPISISADQSVTFRLMMAAESNWDRKTLRLDNVRLSGQVNNTGIDPFQQLLQQRRNQLTGSPFTDPSDPVLINKLASLADSADSLLQTMNLSPSRSHLWPDLASTTNSGHVWHSLTRLGRMALAYSTPGCSKFNDANLRTAILDGLDWLHLNRYNPQTNEYGNWWHWQIGNTQALGNLLVLMHDDLSMAQLAKQIATLNHFLPGRRGWMTGANRSDKVLAAAMHGALAQDPKLLFEARDELTPVFEYVTSGDGVYRDGSMIQHQAIAYSGSYGAELINGVADIYAMLIHSPWQLIDPLHLNTFDWIENVFAPLYFRAAMPDHVRGRAIARPASTDRAIGHYMLASMLRFANAAPQAQGEAIRSWIRTQAESDHRRDFSSAAPLKDYQAAKQLMSDDSLQSTEIQSGHFRFPSMDRVVHHRQNYAYGLAMSSTRVYHYEEINGENLRGWFTGDGVLTLHNSDLAQFEEGYWGTVDMYHLPGVTNSQAVKPNSSGSLRYAKGQWVGGVDLGDFGSSGMHLRPWNDEIQAFKSYFFFANEVVCLGSGISNLSGNSEIHTTVENRKLSSSGNETLVINGATAPAQLGWQESVQNVDWLNLAGTGGIVFPSPTTLQLKRETRTRSYRDVNSNAPDTPWTNHFFTAHINHGAQPDNADYAYILLPDATPSSTSDFAAASPIEILANTPNLQAVHHHQLNLTNAHFWGSQGGTIGNLSVNGPSAVIIQQHPHSLDLAISDPTWQRSTPLTLTLDQSVGSPASLDPRIQVIATEPQLILQIDLTSSRGQSLQASFSKLIAKNDFYSVTPDSALLMDVIANDRSENNAPLSILSHSSATSGQVTLDGNALHYLPNPGFSGVDSFTYQVGDGFLTSTATVTIEVSNQPAPPQINQVVASASQEPNIPENTLDGNLNTRWSAEGGGVWIAFNLESLRPLSGISISFFAGDQRQTFFALEHSLNGTDWFPISGNLTSSGTSLDPETFHFSTPVLTRFIRYVGQGNSSNNWNSLTSVELLPYRNQGPNATPLDLTTAEGESLAVQLSSSVNDTDLWPSPLRVIKLPDLPTAQLDLADDQLTLTPSIGQIAPISFTIQMSDGHRAVNLPVTLSIDQITSWLGYQRTYFTEAELAQASVSGPLASPNQSPYPNLVEFVLGNQPHVAKKPQPLFLVANNPQASGKSLIFLQTRKFSANSIDPAFSLDSTSTPHPSALIGGVVTHVEASNDLITWDDISLTPIPLPATQTPEPNSPNHQVHAFEVDPQPSLFLRLRTQLPQP